MQNEINHAPTNLKHQPIVEVANYNEIDAQYAPESDAVALSIGKAQYNQNDISLKVWRYTENGYSRQSEELPLHRCLDLSILLVGSLLYNPKSNRSVTSLRETEVENQSVQDIKRYYNNNISFLEPRLKELRENINEFLQSNNKK